MIEKIKWLGQSGFRFEDDKTVYIDPFQVTERKDGDIVLITHSHYDHFSLEDIKKVSKEDVVIVGPSDCKVEGNFQEVSSGDKVEVKGIKIEVVPAYNLKRNFHPKNNNWVGYIIEILGKRIYHAGDTDFIPEMNDIKADIVLLPIGGTFTMDVEGAIKAVEAIGPRMAIPMHYGMVAGRKEDGERFRELLGENAYLLSPTP